MIKRRTAAGRQCGDSSYSSSGGTICPICSVRDCAYWDSGHECETLRVELDGDIHTKRTGGAYQMGLFEDELDLMDAVDSYTVTMEDGCRVFLCFREDDHIQYSWTRSGYQEDYQAADSSYPMTMITYHGKIHGRWFSEDTGVYTVIQLLYSENGEKPPKEVIYEEEKLPYVQLKQSDVSDKVWIRVATNEAEVDCKAILDDCEVFMVDSDQRSFDLGNTMRFYETADFKRVWSDDYHRAISVSRGDVELITVEDYRQVEYNIEGSHWSQFEFSECTYEDIYAEWKELNRLAPLKGHQVVWPIYQLADFEYNDITYQVYLRDEETMLKSGYELIFSPEQEKNFSVQISAGNITVEPTTLDKRDRIEDILEEYSYNDVIEVLGCIFLADDEPSAEWLEQYDGDFSWPKVEGYGGTGDSTQSSSQEGNSSGNQNSSQEIGDADIPGRVLGNGLIDMSEFPFYGRANGGVIPVSMGYGSMLLDYYGNEIMSYVMGYPYGEPNDSGYSIMANSDKISDTYYVYDNKGHMIFNWSGPMGNIGLGEENIISLKQYVDERYQITYYNSDGSILYDTGEYDSVGYSAYDAATAFYDGKAYMSIYKEGAAFGVNLDSPDGKGTAYLYELDLDGKATRIDTGFRFVVDDHADGYLVMMNPDTYDYQLFDTKTEKYSEHLTEIPALLILNEEEAEGVSEDAMISTWSLEQFEANNEYYYHCENYGVISASYGSVSKDMLFDFFDVKDGRLAKAVAVYDKIVMNQHPYLLAKDGDVYFYIDLEGKVVSDTYQNATSFNDSGLAIIVEDGVASLMDDHFNIITVIEDLEVKFAENNGDVFKIYDTNGEEYLFYYEVK